MDDAEALNLYSIVDVIELEDTSTSRKDMLIASKGSDVSLPGAFSSADLGGSSKYSSEILEDQCGEGFHVNSS
jgi:hypothetical protein